MTEYQLYCFAQSGHSYKAALMLALCGADWEPRFVDFFNGEARSPEFRAINVMGECPALVHGERTVTQSGVIMEYLGKRFGKFMPEGEDDRLETLRWTIWENHKLCGMMGFSRFFHSFAPEKIKSPDVEKFTRSRALTALEVLDRHMENRDWVVGDAPSIADIGCSGYIYYPDEEHGFAIADYPAVDAWRQRLAGLPGWKHPYDLMPGAPEGWSAQA